MDGRQLEMIMEESRPDGMPDLFALRHPVLCCRTRTVRSGSLTEVECFPVYVGPVRRQLKRVRPTQQAQRTVNDRNARKRFERLAEANFTPGTDLALTLTYAGEPPMEMEQCNRDIRNYLDRVNRARARLGLPKAKCVGVIETGKHGRLHHHLIVSGGLDRDQMERLWRKGFANADRIQAGPTGLAALARYMTKGFSTKRETGRHRYFATRNLVKPVVTESLSRISRRQAERIAEDADLYGEQVLRKKYPGLQLESIEIRRSEWLPGCYIYARMRARP